MTHLSAEEAADRAQCRALVFQHPVKGQDRTVTTNDPEYTEPAQRIDRYDAVGLQGERHVYETHRAQVAISSKALAGRKRDRLKTVAKKVVGRGYDAATQECSDRLSAATLLSWSLFCHTRRPALGYGNSSSRRKTGHSGARTYRDPKPARQRA